MRINFKKGNRKMNKTIFTLITAPIILSITASLLVILGDPLHVFIPVWMLWMVAQLATASAFLAIIALIILSIAGVAARAARISMRKRVKSAYWMSSRSHLAFN